MTGENPEAFDRALQCLRRGGCVHAMGVGGVGVAGLAVLLAARGWKVSGCDLDDGPLIPWLRARGIKVTLGHGADHLASAPDWLIHTAAIPPDHPELERARALGIPISRRGEALAALTSLYRSIAVAGSHGKTTTTTMVTHLFRSAGADPWFAIGADVPALGGVAGAGTSPWLVVEADESDGTLRLYVPDILVVTNVDYDHMEHFRDVEEFYDVFRAAIQQTRTAVCYCADDPAAARLGAAYPRAVGFGFHESAVVRAVARTSLGAQGQAFEVWLEGRRLAECRLPCPGEHNVRNALGALAVARVAGLDLAQAIRALGQAPMPRRRLDVRLQRAEICVLADYAHHPTEIRVLLRTVQEWKRPQRILAVFQPHRFTRTRALKAQFPPAFAGVSALLLLPVYAASEPPLEGGTSEDLLAEFRRQRVVETDLVETLAQAREWLEVRRQPGDLILIIGAGSVDALATELAQAWA